MKRWLYPLFWMLLGIGLSAVFFLIAAPPRGSAVNLLPPPTPMPIIVDIHGAVNQPGVYFLPEGSRIKDAVEAAGGMIMDTDRDAVNLAARIKDGEKITIPYLGDTKAASILVDSGEEPSGRSTPLENQVVDDIVNINTATLEQLTELPGIGPALAEKIILYREAHGHFGTIDDIMNVSGIGPSKFEQLKNQISVE